MTEYDFKTLSPSDFELLLRDLLSAEFQMRLEAFGHGKDGGVDLRGWVNGQKIVVQCKHYTGSSFRDLRRAAQREVIKMVEERPDRYLFATSQNLSKTQKDTLVEDLRDLLRSPADLLAQLDINQIIARHPEVERQHFKLWLASTEVLERIVHNRIWERSEALMEDIRDRVKLYVRSPGYERANEILDCNHVVVLTGAPGVGKSMLAEMLALAHWHDGWQVITISSDIDEGWDAFRRSEKQMFFYDDFLGQTDISERTNKNEDSRIVRFMDRIATDPSKRLVMTTRSQILRQATLAREPLARGGFPFRECVVQVADYGKLERARILYNHLYFSKLPRQVVRQYASERHYWSVINHPNFSPRIIEQVLRRNSSDAESLADILVATLDRPIDLWGTMFAAVLSEMAQRIVLALITFPPRGVSIHSLRAVVRKGGSPIEFTHALKALEGTFVDVAQGKIDRNDLTVSYANPSVRDFVLATLDDEPEFIWQLLGRAQNVRQVLTLLEYASAILDGRRKFPGLAGAISSNQREIANTVLAFAYSTHERATSENGKWRVQSSLIRPLAQISCIAADMLPTISMDVLNAALKLYEQNRVEDGIADTLQCLTLGLIVNTKGSLETISEQLRSLIADWANALDETGEIESFVRFIGKYGPSLRPFLDLESITDGRIEEALREDIETMTSNRRDEDSDLNWLNQIESVAREAGMLDRLISDIEDERSSTVEHYLEHIEEDTLISKWGAKDPEYRYDKADSYSNVENMFHELS